MSGNICMSGAVPMPVSAAAAADASCFLVVFFCSRKFIRVYLCCLIPAAYSIADFPAPALLVLCGFACIPATMLSAMQWP